MYVSTYEQFPLVRILFRTPGQLRVLSSEPSAQSTTPLHSISDRMHPPYAHLNAESRQLHVDGDKCNYKNIYSDPGIELTRHGDKKEQFRQIHPHNFDARCTDHCNRLFPHCHSATGPTLYCWPLDTSSRCCYYCYLPALVQILFHSVFGIVQRCPPRPLLIL